MIYYAPGGVVAFLFDKQLMLITASQGVLNIGYPLQDKINLLDDDTLFVKIEQDDIVIGDKNSSYRYFGSSWEENLVTI